MSHGDALLAWLTEEQRAIVEQLGQGPVKVSAAAGSGKTTTMAALYTRALQAGVLPSRILAVTFTERAASELRERIITTLPRVGLQSESRFERQLPGAWIGTFHHVARRLLAEMAYRAEVPMGLRTLDEVEARLELEAAASVVRDSLAGQEALRDLQEFELPPKTLLELVAGATDAVTRLRSTDLTGEECRRNSEAAYHRFMALGDPDAEVAWHRLALDVTLAIWERYEARLEALRSLDFDGLLRMALDRLRRSSALSSWCHDNFQLVIVDEFQDTSQVQSALLDQLVGEDRRKLFVVGDARQSIFAFRDAKPGIMAGSPGRSFRLFRNHRSLPPILAAADHVIRADLQFAADDPMEVGRQHPVAPPVLLGLAATPEEEAEGIAAFIEAVHLQGIPHGGEHHQVGYGDFAVLAYTFGRLGRPLEDALRRRGIPFQTATGGLLERPEVKDLLALLRAVVDPDDDEAWVRILQSPWVRVSDQQLVELVGARDGRNHSIAERVSGAVGAGGLPPQVEARVAGILSAVADLRVLASHRSAGEVVGAALANSRLLAYHQALQGLVVGQGERSLAAVRDLQRMAVAAQSSSRWLGVGEFLERIETLGNLRGQAEPAPREQRSLVTLSTIHRAKGLEWPVVILADCRPHHQRGRERVVWDREQLAVVMPLLAHQETGAGKRFKGSRDSRVPAEEHRRLIYVAMTRARDLLAVTTTRAGTRTSAKAIEEVVAAVRGGDSGKGEYAELLRVVADGGQGWVGLLPGFPGAIQLPWEVEVGAAVAPPGPPAAVPGADLSRAALRRLVQEPSPRVAEVACVPQRLSFSALQTFAACPRQFWFRYVVGFPDPQTQADGGVAEAEIASEVDARERSLGIGSLVHRVLERWHQGSFPPQPADLEVWVDRLGVGMPTGDTDEARSMLRDYVALPVAGLRTQGVEVPFVWRGWGGPGLPPLSGVIDRIAEAEDGSRLVVDYKTNAALSAAQAETYSHQLRLYCMALEAMSGGTAPIGAAAMVMLRDGRLRFVDCGEQARGDTLRWARALAQRLVGAGELSGLRHPTRPCHSCPYLAVCPERLEIPPPTAALF